MKSAFVQIGTAMIGAALQEIVYWYDLRGKLHVAKYKQMMRDKSYWLITLIMICLSGFGTWIWYASDIQSLRAYLITGAALPLLLKKSISAVSDRQVRLGAESPASTVRDYFFSS